MRAGSLCTGYGGLELALGLAGVDAHLAWTSENDPDAARVAEARFPDSPNIGDLRDATPDPVDILTAGFPCQPISTAGRGKGVEDDRWLWPDIEAFIGRLERPPGWVLLENVPRLLTINGGDAMAAVVSGLARLGYVGAYRLLRATDVGACHRRQRLFIAATHADGTGDGTQPRIAPGHEETAGGLRRVGAEDDHEPGGPRPGRLLPTPNAWDGARGPDLARQRERAATGSGGDDLTTTVAKLLPTPTAWLGSADARGDLNAEERRLASAKPGPGQHRSQEVTSAIARLLPTPRASDEKTWEDEQATLESIHQPRGEGGRGTLADIPRLLPTPTATDSRGGRNATLDRQPGKAPSTGYTLTDVAWAERWGPYVDAINRHVGITGVLPPDPADEGRRLNPEFVEWMMMLPPGWVTGLDLPRTAQLRILGNGVVPAQAAVAFTDLLADPA